MEVLKVAKWGNGLAIRLPAKMARELQLQEGDLLSRDVMALRKCLPKLTREQAAENIRAMQWAMPSDWKVNRNDPDMRG